MTTVVLKIRWQYVTERVRLNLDAILVGLGTIRTEETSGGSAEIIEYRPIVTYARNTLHGHNIELLYEEEAHTELKGKGVIWGTTTIQLEPDLCHGVVSFASNPPRSDDGRADLEISIEKPASQLQRESITRIKRLQTLFKGELLRRGKNCEISGETFVPVLEAAHVLDLEAGGPNCPENGLLLRADIHKLFDDGYFTINADGTLSLDSRIIGEYECLLRTARVSEKTMQRIAEFLPLRRKRTLVRAKGA